MAASCRRRISALEAASALSFRPRIAAGFLGEKRLCVRPGDKKSHSIIIVTVLSGRGPLCVQVTAPLAFQLLIHVLTCSCLR